MPVTELLVEGELDAVLLRAVFEGKPPVRMAGSKSGLKPKAVEERRRNPLSTTSYIRDRDFDIDPPADRSRPQVHTSTASGQPLGWYWCRHEMENYLLDPGIVARALACDAAAYRGALLDAAARIVDYQAARAVIGAVRRSLPPNNELHTRPPSLKECALPGDLSSEATSSWACAQADAYRARICPQLEAHVMKTMILARSEFLSAQIISSPDEVLVWFAGKDLLAALAQTPWFVAMRLPNAGELRVRLRQWVLTNPTDALAFLPEWQRFNEVVNAP